MSFINRNANLILLFLIVGSAVALVGLTVFFQRNFTDVNLRYNEKLGALKNISDTLERQQSLVIQAKQELDLLRARDVDFSQKFTSVKETKEGLEDERQTLLLDKADLTLRLAKAETNVTILSDEAKKFSLLYRNLQVDYSQLESDNLGLRNKVNKLEKENSDLRNNP
ncbi:TPA: hypothetical protein HA246_01725 [Candidatus Woesearchaeota archaeon]|nr:hypothetical protein [Candidatus Woesearchaeota archaeon]